MSTSVDRRELNQIPDEETIASFRETADEQDVSIEARYPSVDGEKRLVVSPRGTVTILNDVSEATFNRSQPAAEIAAALRK
jgi:hypothetical protein